MYTSPDGKTYRPSMFLTLTCDSYGKVTEDGVPADPDSYDYHRAARDALAFAALFDRFIQNLRRFPGYDVQYFAAIEPQRRLAPHAHIALRGTISRADLRQVLAATYHQIWWPPTDTVRFDADHVPVWHEATGGYLDPATGEVLPTWDQALDAIGEHDAPLHVARFGAKFDAQGVLAGSKDSGRCIRYLTKYLTKHIAGCHHRDTPAQEQHAARLLDALRYEPCSPTCANWLRYGIQPKNPRDGMRPGTCKGKAHPAREPRLRRAPGPGLPQMVGQDPRRSPRRPQSLAAFHARPARPRRHRPLPVGTGHPRRRRLHDPWQAHASRPGRPRPLARRARRNQAKSRRNRRRPTGHREGSVMAAKSRPDMERLLTVSEVADLLGTSERFPRRLIAERRIRFVRVGRHVRIPVSALRDFISAGLVEPVIRSRRGSAA